jgi:tryptophan synthase beta chain
MKKVRQVSLPVADMPISWYNIIPDLPDPLPPPQGDTTVLDKTIIKECLAQEFSQDNWIEIPEELQETYQQIGRPRPMFRAVKLEKLLDTPAELYYKAEGLFSPTGSHKINTAVAQAYYAKKQGLKRLVTETGAGQWGTALACAARITGLRATVYWVRAVYKWKDARRDFMKLYGAEVHASPSENTETGRKLLKSNPDHPGSLAIAISEGLEDALSDNKAAYVLGSVLNHVLLHQTIIGLECKKQLEMIDRYPDVVVSCLGGGSNFGGIALPFLGDVLTKGKKTRFVAAQSQSAPNLQGEYRYDNADYSGLTPKLKMYTLGHTTDMAPIFGDGLRYHGCSPILSLLRNKGYIDTVAYPVDEKYVFESAKTFLREEGFLPAPESAYSIAAAIDEAKRCKESGERKAILFNISGHGFMDMEGYRQVLRI